MTRRHDWAVRVPATSANLGPGFDVLGLALDLHLVVGSRVRDGARDRVTTTGQGAGEVATDDDNLVWRSFVRGCDAWDVPVPDLAIDVHNAIPLERGLGSSSSAIVAGLALARAGAGTTIGDLDVVRLADEIEGHPDNVAPAVLGGFVAAARRDDGTLAIRRAQPPAGARIMVHVPTGRQITTSARGALPDHLTREDVASQVGRTAFVTGGLTGTWPMDAQVVGDVLHEPARRRGLHVSDEIMTALRDRGIVTWLSGSGPTVASLVSATGPVPWLDRSDVQVGWPDDDDDGVVAEVVMDVLAIDLGGVVVCPRDGCAWAENGACGSCPHRRL